jgi:hypothetical protein
VPGCTGMTHMLLAMSCRPCCAPHFVASISSYSGLTGSHLARGTSFDAVWQVTWGNIAHASITTTARDM